MAYCSCFQIYWSYEQVFEEPMNRCTLPSEILLNFSTPMSRKLEFSAVVKGLRSYMKGFEFTLALLSHIRETIIPHSLALTNKS